MSEPRRRDRNSKPGGPQTGKTTGTQTENKPRTRELPPYRVILHNDDVSEMGYVVRTIMELTHYGRADATKCMLEAHTHGLSLLLITHKERAELYAEQFASKRLTASIEPA